MNKNGINNLITILQPLFVMGMLSLFINYILDIVEFPESLSFIVVILKILQYLFGILTVILFPILFYAFMFKGHERDINTHTAKKIEKVTVTPNTITLLDGNIFEVLISIRLLINDENIKWKGNLYTDFMKVSDEVIRVPRTPENLDFFDTEAYHEFNTLKALLKTLNDGVISIKDAHVSQTLSLVSTGLEKHAVKYKEWKLEDLKEETMILEVVINKEKC